MIGFACKECGKRHQRPEEAAGTLVFCSCGAGNRVPWESTAPVPESTNEPAPATPWGGGRPAAPAAEDEEPAPRPTRRSGPRRPDPGHCLNHADTTSSKTCADCREAFCDGCVVTLQGATLCGPCKNFRLRSMQRPAQPSACAIFSLIVAVVTGPFGFCVWMSLLQPETMPPGSAPFFALIGSGGPLVALLLGLKAIWDVNRQPRLSGRGLAVLGMTSAAISLLWCLSLALIATGRHFFGE
jgi:hypothetical protein